MSEEKNINVTITRPGFKSIISNLIGQIVAFTIIALIAVIVVVNIFIFLWPTIKWLIPLSVFFIYILFMLYKITQMEDSEVKSHNQYKTTLLLSRTVIVLIILFYDIESVAM